MITSRASSTTIILERVHPDASGNNDRQREFLSRMTIEEARAFAVSLAASIEEAVHARAMERQARLIQAQAELREAAERLTALRAEIHALEGGDLAEQPAPAVMTEDELLKGLEAAGLVADAPVVATPGEAPSSPIALTATAFVEPTPSKTVAIGGSFSNFPATTDNLEIPGFLRRTA
jgi:hypothetical protein